MYLLNDWLRRQSLTSIITVKSMEEKKQTYSFLDFMADCIISLDQRTTDQVRTRRLKVIKYRGSGFLSNEHPYMISSNGTVLLPVSGVTLEYPASDRRISTGNDVFDSITGGGFFRGASILVAGPSGSGKTTLAATFARAAGSRNEKTLYVSFEESQEVLLSRIKSVGIDLDQDVNAGRLKICSLLPETAGIEQHLLWIFDTVDNFDPAHLVVDAISACQRMGSQQAGFDFLLRLITFCRKKKITCIYTDQADAENMVTQISGFQLSSVMDMLVSLQYADTGTGISRRLLVVKSRGSAHSMQYHPFTITGRGIDIQFPGDKTGDIARQEG
jgi:circadian clock protein KaiC